MRTYLVFAFVLGLAGTSHAEDAPQKPPPRDALYPVQLTGSMALGPMGPDGRWGLSIERHPARGFGLGFGGALGWGALAVPSSDRGVGAFWISPVLRPGYYFHKRDEAWISGALGVAIAPIIDVTTMGDVRFAMTAQPGFTLAVERFTFGMSMLLGAAIVPEPGFYVGVVMGLGATI